MNHSHHLAKAFSQFDYSSCIIKWAEKNTNLFDTFSFLDLYGCDRPFFQNSKVLNFLPFKAMLKNNNDIKVK
ncbi:hypothetical protein CN925_00820 [Bacillus sp. AFS055030]|nr:hypothetical protein CN925_00820 [Bacillus sp. AFS055030]